MMRNQNQDKQTTNNNQEPKYLNKKQQNDYSFIVLLSLRNLIGAVDKSHKNNNHRQ